MNGAPSKSLPSPTWSTPATLAMWSMWSTSADNGVRGRRARVSSSTIQSMRGSSPSFAPSSAIRW